MMLTIHDVHQEIARGYTILINHRVYVLYEARANEVEHSNRLRVGRKKSGSNLGAGTASVVDDQQLSVDTISLHSLKKTCTMVILSLAGMRPCLHSHRPASR